MEQITKQLNDIRGMIKECICNTLTDIYRHFNNGNLPNYEEEEEVLVEGSKIKTHLTINVNVHNTYTEDVLIEKWCIDDYIVTLDYNLMFVCNDNEIEWTEISTDDLFYIAKTLKNKLKQIKVN
jgi:hypothetical protein